MDPVFRALADSSRRLLLDRLHVQDGQTLRALCADLDMTRQAVTKHLVILEDAGLVRTTWKGREKLHHLDPAPLLQLTTDWLRKYERMQSAHPERTTAARPAGPAPAPHPTEIDGESRWTNL